jgi:hypothetical protein
VADWATIASLGTAAGTLVLAVATFASVRTANRGARATERALLAGIRPVLVPSRLHDPPEKVGFADNHWVKVPGGRGIAEATDDVVYFAIALRNVGNGLAVLDRWDFYPERATGETDRHEPEVFRRLTRDIYVPPGDLGFWQGAYRNPSEPAFRAAHDAVTRRQAVTIDLLYGDHEGGQRTVTRFGLTPSENGEWMVSASRHWNLDRADPR